ncbi:hypothetical protein CRG98_033734 [Punica granatum]|uniref:Uncharacterized protein n=1 Tax=Punica granatum TaxID=22663 RepID=A0A2I0IPJ9_PUNGR|nr:hypothetical protein CRG98_033734 [Punica granatum]
MEARPKEPNFHELLLVGCLGCDEETGHAIVLDLSSSCLDGSIGSRSSLFRLAHLQRLSLADNDFDRSRITSGFGRLSGFTQLDLSGSSFSGHLLNLSYVNISSEVPRSVANLSPLRTLILDLSVSFSRAEYFSYPTWIKFDWKIVLMGNGSGLVIVMVIGSTFASDEHDWLARIIVRVEEHRRRQGIKRKRG